MLSPKAYIIALTMLAQEWSVYGEISSYGDRRIFNYKPSKHRTAAARAMRTTVNLFHR